MNRRFWHRVVGPLKRCGGTNLIEAAILTPLLLLLSFSIVEFASIFYVYLALENGVTQATRFAVTGQTLNDPVTGTPMSRQASVILAMQRATPSLTIDSSAFSFSHLSGGTWSPGFAASGEVGKVTVDYTWSIMTPLLKPFFTNGRVHVTVDSAMKNESF
jgi:Flp pilus assembly protein TadG